MGHSRCELVEAFAVGKPTDAPHGASSGRSSRYAPVLELEMAGGNLLDAEVRTFIPREVWLNEVCLPSDTRSSDAIRPLFDGIDESELVSLDAAGEIRDTGTRAKRENAGPVPTNVFCLVITQHK